MRILNILNLFRKKPDNFEPTKIEQDIAYEHACLRHLERPNTSYLKFGFGILILLLLASILGLGIHWFFTGSVGLKFLPKTLYDFHLNAPIAFKVLLILFIDCFVLILLSRRILIEVIKLYQRYADEEIRRRCLFKPTCSEYTIMSLNKYGLIIGLYLGYMRVFRKCKGNIYRIDYP